MRPVVDGAEGSPRFAPEKGPNGNHASPAAGAHCIALERGAPEASLNHEASPLFISAGVQVCFVIRLRRMATVGCWPAGRKGCCPGGRRCVTENAATLPSIMVNAKDSVSAPATR